MSLADWLTLGLLTATVSGVITSFYFLYRQQGLLASQTESLRISLRTAGGASLHEWHMQISQVLLSHPNLRPFIYEGRDPAAVELSSESVQRLDVLVEALLDTFEHALWLEDQGADLRGGADAWDAYMRDIIGNSPAVKNYLLAHKDWYDRRLLDLAEPKARE